MRKLCLLSGTLIILIVLQSCRNWPKEAGNYNEVIVGIQNGVIDKVSVLNDEFNTFDNVKIAKAMAEANTHVENAIVETTELHGFDDKTYLKDSLMSFLKTAKVVLDTDYKKMAEIYKLPEEDWENKEIYEQFNDLKDEARILFNTASENLITAQQKFSDDYGIKIKKNKE